jgi:hypothetical protein
MFWSHVNRAVLAITQCEESAGAGSIFYSESHWKRVKGQSLPLSLCAINTPASGARAARAALSRTRDTPKEIRSRLRECSEVRCVDLLDLESASLNE